MSEKGKEVIGVIDELKMGGFTENEIERINLLIASVPEGDRHDLIGELISKIPDEVKHKIAILRESIKIKESEKLSDNAGFNEFREILGKKNEILSKLFKVSDIYFSNRLNGIGLSELEINKVKLVLWDKLLSLLNLKGGMKLVTGKIESKIKSLFDIFNKNGGDKKEKTDIAGVLEGLEKVGEELSSFEEPKEGKSKELFDYFDDIIGESFIKVKKEKGKGIKFESIEGTSIILYPKDKKRTLEDIKNSTIKKAQDFDGLKKTGDSVVDLVKKLPESLQTSIKDFLNNLVKDFPLLGFILGLFFPLDFLNIDKKEQEKKQSILNLITLAEKEDSPIKGLDKENFEKLDLKELKKFFEYLDAKEIDYSKEGFWEAIFTGKTNDDKLLGLFNLLKGDKDNFELTDEDKKDNAKGFIQLLNDLPKKEEKQSIIDSNKKQEQLQQEIERLEKKGKQGILNTPENVGEKHQDTSGTVDNNGDSQLVPQVEETGTKTVSISTETQEQQEARLSEIKKLREQMQKEAFDNSIRMLSGLPPATEILYKGEKVLINIESGKDLLIGGKKFKIEVLPKNSTSNIYKEILFNEGLKIVTSKGGGFLGLSALETSVTKEDFKGVLVSLLDGKNYESSISGDKAIIKISQIV